MKFLQRYSLYILTAYAIIVLVATIVLWDTLALTQRLVAIATVIVAAHEWEEQRIPGGFMEMMTKMMGIKVEPARMKAMAALPDVLIFVMTAIALLFPQVVFFSCAVLVVGIFEGVVHIIGVKLNRLPHPYTPGMVTAEAFAVFSIVGIVLLAQSNVAGAWDWVLGVIWFFVCFGVMEINVWRIAGLSPKDLPAKMKSNISKRSERG